MSRELLHETAGLALFSGEVRRRTAETVVVLREMARGGQPWAPMRQVLRMMWLANARSIWNARVTQGYRRLYWKEEGWNSLEDSWEEAQLKHRELLELAQVQLDDRRHRTPRVWQRLIQSYTEAAVPGVRTGLDVGPMLERMAGTTPERMTQIGSILRPPRPTLWGALLADETGRLPLSTAVELCFMFGGLAHAAGLLLEETTLVMATVARESHGPRGRALPEFR